MSSPPSHRKIIAAFACVYVFWGSTFLAIRFAVENTPPFLVGAFRYLIAGGLLFLFHIRKWKYSQISKTELSRAILVGLLLPCLGNGLVIWSEQRIPSGAAALWVATVPIWIIFFNWLSFERKKPTFPEFLGAGVGSLGVGLLSSSNIDPKNWLSIGALIVASISWSIGSLIQRSTRYSIPTLQSSAIQMFTAGIFLLLTGTLMGEWPTLLDQGISLVGIASILYLSIIGSILTFTVYTWLLGAVHPQKVATYALANPVVALILGSLFAGEVISIRMIFASCLVIGGVGLILLTSKSKLKFLTKNKKIKVIPSP